MNKLYVIGIGAGNRGGMTLDAEKAIRQSDLIVGYTVYVDLLRAHFPDKEYVSTAMKQEAERVRAALDNAQSKTVSLVCSGDSAVYGMAGLALELSHEFPEVDIEVIAGVSAAMSGSAVLGAVLTNDFAVISLSDLITPREIIEKRLECAAEADFIIVLYNPSSKKRAGYLARACEIMLKHKPKDTVCGTVRNIGRDGEESRIMTLGQLKDESVDMFTAVFIGNCDTVVIGDKIVTPRGYSV
jgi:precorrin-3B C17-methyltransferase